MPKAVHPHLAFLFGPRWKVNKRKLRVTSLERTHRFEQLPKKEEKEKKGKPTDDGPVLESEIVPVVDDEAAGRLVSPTFLVPSFEIFRDFRLPDSFDVSDVNWSKQPSIVVSIFLFRVEYKIIKS